MTEQYGEPERAQAAQALKAKILDLSAQYYRLQHSPRRDFVQGERITYGGRVFDEQEIMNVVDSALDFWLTTGPYAADFERRFADFLSIGHCSLTNSGSSANLLAFMALTSPQLGQRRICRGDEVITVAAGFPTTVAPIVQFGAVPVFVDVTLPTYNIDADRLREALSGKTKAVLRAHTLATRFDLQTVRAFCD